MTPERWQHVDDIFHLALEHAPAERSAFLAGACGGDEALRKEVESLLASHDIDGSFMDAPAYLAAELLMNDQSELKPGQTVGSYNIISLLGRGGMGEVYLAQDVRLGRKVALKILTASLSGDRNRLRRFEQEARTASGLNHPNILTIHGIEEVDGRRIIATEFIDGRTLRQLMAESSPDLHETLEITIHIASALVAAHRVKIVHRDIKPENIMVRREDGLVKVLDFGLAKATETPTVTAPDPDAPTRALINTGPGVVMGTVAYMSPEQARGQTVDERTDIWSVGVVLYEMIAGKVPFAGSNANEILSQILSREQPAPLTRFTHNLPAELDRIITKALTKDREERYQSAKDLLIDLKRLRQKLEVEAEIERVVTPETDARIAGATVRGQAGAATIQDAGQTATVITAHPTTSAEYIVTEIKRHKRGLLLALAILVVAGAGVGYWLYKFISQSPLPSRALKITRLTSTGKAIYAAISPDGKYVVYAQDEGGQQSLWLSQVAILSNVQIAPPAAVNYGGITFSRDGNLIYYVRNESGIRGALYQSPALGGGGERKLLVNVHSPVTLSPDGKRLAFVRRYPTSPGGDGLIVANADGSEEKTLFTLKQPNLFGAGAPAWSPDGKIIACGQQDYSGSFYSNVIGVRVADGTQTPIGSQDWALNIGRLEWLADGSGLVVAVPEQQGYLPQIWHIPYPSGDARRIVNDLDSYSDVTMTADSRTLAAVRADRVINIWVTSSGDVSHVKQITAGEGREDGTGGLDWTPDGRIVFRSAVGGPHLWIVSADGTGSRQLTVGTNHNTFPSVSADGRYIVWGNRAGGRGVTQLWRMDIDGSNQKQLTEIGGIGAWFHRLSPDGKWVVYGTMSAEGFHSLWKVSIDGGAQTQLTNKPSWMPVVSPDGKLIACNWLNEATGLWDIAILPFEGGSPIKILDNSGGGYARRLVWTPDGRTIAFLRLDKGVDNIWAQPIDGGSAKQLTDFKDQRIFTFAWSRDGKQLALSRGTMNSDVILISGFK
jgi:serine/threonine protein kinase/Tol biopolymer transport system component